MTLCVRVTMNALTDHILSMATKCIARQTVRDTVFCSEAPSNPMADLPSPSMFIFTALVFMPLGHSIPFAVFHGIADSCFSTYVKDSYTIPLSNWSRSPGYCIEIGNGAIDSVFMPLSKQIDIACEKVKSMPELSGGYNIVGLSQGNLVARGVIEFCDGGPPVKNYISLGGPHAGIGQPAINCGSLQWACSILASMLKQRGVYEQNIQGQIAPSNYFKDPKNMTYYYRECEFLPKLSNEIVGMRNAKYKERFASLQNLVLIMFDQENVLVPKETSWFGFYPDGALEPVLPMEETLLYKNDWIGLRTLNEAGKVKLVNVTGAHLDMANSDMKLHIVPYLQDHASTRTRTSGPDVFRLLRSEKR